MLLPRRRVVYHLYKTVFPRNVTFLNFQLAVNMIVYLRHFLAVKIADRIQQLSRERCPGCMGHYILDNFHACVKNLLPDRISLFLPKVKAEALDKLDNLIEMYQQATWAEPELVRQSAMDFILALTADDLLDRRYINEDTVELHPFNMTWLQDTPNPIAPPQQPTPTKSKPTKSVKDSKKRKSENNEIEVHLPAKFSKND